MNLPKDIERTNDGPISPLQMTVVALLALVFIFCLARTFGSLHARVSAAPPSPVERAETRSSEAHADVSTQPADASPTADEPVTAQTSAPSGGILVAGRLPLDLESLQSAEADLEPAPTPRPSPKKKIVLEPAQPEEVTADVPPPAPPEPVAIPTPVPSPTTVTVKGRLLRRGFNGTVLPVVNHQVYLVDLADPTTAETTTDVEGAYTISGLKPGNLYYVISMYEEQFQYGMRASYQFGWNGHGYGYTVGGQEPDVARNQYSWHEAFIAPPPGTYGLDLDAGNADPEYCSDIRPTDDAITRTPYRSFRQCTLQPI